MCSFTCVFMMSDARDAVALAGIVETPLMLWDVTQTME